MFTGLIEEIGTIKFVEPVTGGKKFTFSANKILDDLKVDDSVAVNGVCLTAVRVTPDSFTAEAVGETLRKSTLNSVLLNSSVNLERAMKLSDRLGGHIVQGHVNGIGTVTNIKQLGNSVFLELEIPPDCEKYVIDEGSIAINGVSLTVASINGLKVHLSIIPHTWKMTTLNVLTIGSKVNIETDFIAKYIEKFLVKGKTENNSGETFSDNWFKQLGY